MEETKPQHHWTWQHRYKLAPVYALIATTILGFASYALSGPQAVLSTLVLTGGALALVQGRWGRRKRKDKAMLRFMWACVLACAGIIVTIRFGLLSGEWTFVIMIGCAMVLGLFWWFDQRNQRVIEIEDELRRWPALAKDIGIPKVHKMPKRVTETGEEHILWWDKGATTLEAVRAHSRQIEQALGIPFKKIRFEHITNSKGLIDSSRWRITANTDSPILDAPVPFTEPTMRSIYDPMLVGQLENGENYYVTWYEKSWGGRHTLAGGQTGSGKSGLFDLVFAESLYCRNLVKWGMDRKGGMAYLPWAPTFDWIATDEKGCIAMLSAVKEVLEYRSKIAGERNWKVWRATAKEPLLLVNIDEAAEVLGSWGPATELVASITRRGRAAGVLLYLAVQHLTAEAISSSQITKNIGRRFCFSCSDHGMQYYILPNSKDTVDACSIPLGPAHAGTFYVSDGNVLNPLSGRVRYVDEARVRELVVGLGDRTPVLDVASREAAQQGSCEFPEELTYDGRKHYLVEDLPALEDDTSDEDDGWDPNEETESTEHASEHTSEDTEHTSESAESTSTDGRSDDRGRVHLGKAPTTDRADAPTMERETPMIDAELLPTRAALSEMSFAEMSALIDPEVLKQAQIAFQVEMAQNANVTDVEALDRLSKALDATGQKPIQVKDLLPIVGREKTWMHARLADLAAKGEVEKVRRGLYRRPDGWKPVLELVHAQ
jgi:S-DNA-T family DNA segregation ATPase FtsK/SpoIIIE